MPDADADLMDLELPPAALAALEHAEVGDPFAILGPQRSGGRYILRTWLPRARDRKSVV